VAQLSLPFDGLPAVWAAPLYVGFAVIVFMFAWTGVLFVRGQRARLHAPDAPPSSADEFTWIFLVPALNEEVTIRDSVERLIEVEVRSKRIVVIDDGSDDCTPEILRSISHPDLVVLRRDAPNARLGKAAGLNNAYRVLADELGPEVDRSRVIVAIVDADGRLDPLAPRFAAAHFADPKVGGVQSLVRIYNRQRFLTWMQDVEFSVYGFLFQAGRNGWGTAGMGGNGQFNRLSALDAIAGEEGPWRDRLTEDQDLGLRLMVAGYEGRQELRGAVNQQGLSSLRRLFRQRTRWSQGNLQALSLTGDVRRMPFPLAVRTEVLLYLLMPLWQTIVGIALVIAIILAATGEAALWGGGPTWQLALVYVLTFGGTVLGCIASRTSAGAKGWVAGFLLGHLYALYTWLLWPVLVRSSARQLTERRDWAKTEREAIDSAAPQDRELQHAR
jgi:1,2-diacylglycerol 3-beta-glucosyltransferase